MILKNNIKMLLDQKGISINKIATDLDIHYPTMHKLVTRDTLNSTTLESLYRVAEYLDAPLNNLFKKA